MQCNNHQFAPARLEGNCARTWKFSERHKVHSGAYLDAQRARRIGAGTAPHHDVLADGGVATSGRLDRSANRLERVCRRGAASGVLEMAPRATPLRHYDYIGSTHQLRRSVWRCVQKLAIPMGGHLRHGNQTAASLLHRGLSTRACRAETTLADMRVCLSATQ